MFYWMYECSSNAEQSHLEVWFPCWYRESSRGHPRPPHTSPPQGISAYFSCQSPSDWQDPAMSVPYTEERWAIFRRFENSFCITTEVSNTRCTFLEIQYRRCSSSKWGSCSRGDLASCSPWTTIWDNFMQFSIDVSLGARSPTKSNISKNLF